MSKQKRAIVILESMVNVATKRIEELEAELTTKTVECGALQAEIDELMFEYCPDEMTAKQIHDYGIAQQKVAYLDIPAFLRRDCDKSEKE